MLRFYIWEDYWNGLVLEFQYIQCYGSITNYLINKVRDAGFQYIQCYGSILLYRWFQNHKFLFQYIQCYGSITV